MTTPSSIATTTPASIPICTLGTGLPVINVGGKVVSSEFKSDSVADSVTDSVVGSAVIAAWQHNM